MHRRAFLIGGFGALVLPACVSKPKMTLHHAEVRNAGPMGIGLEIFLNVRNENDFDIQVRNVRTRAVLQERWALAPTMYSPNVWLPANRVTVVQAPQIIPWPMVAPLLAETAMNAYITYHVTGQADVTATSSLKIDSNNQEVDETGSVPRMAILQAAQFGMPTLRF
jgi:hypothetical protein